MANNQDPITARIGDPQLDTPQTSAAIDDIVAQEADEVLAAEDANQAAMADEAEPLQAPRRRGHPIFWFIIILLVIVALAGAYLLVNPGSAYAP